MQRRRASSGWIVPAVAAALVGCSGEPGGAAERRLRRAANAVGRPGSHRHVADRQAERHAGATAAELRRPAVPHRRRVRRARRAAARLERALRRRDRRQQDGQRALGRDGPAEPADFVDHGAGGRPPSAADGRRRAPLRDDDEQLVRHFVRRGRGLQRARPLHHARHARIDVPVHVQQRHRDHAGARLRRDSSRARPRDAARAPRRPAAARGRDRPMARRLARAFRGRHARHRDPQLQRRNADADRRPRRQADPDEPRPARRRAAHARRQPTRSTTRSPSRIRSC